jgi:hypothetical protein
LSECLDPRLDPPQASRANLLRMDSEIRKAIREHMHKLAVERGAAGGKARAKNMSAARRTEAAKKAARARWAKKHS